MKYEFADAIARQEVPAFFKGEGPYLKPDPDWGDHLFIRTWESVVAYLKEQDNPLAILTHYFRVYLDSLVEKRSDADSIIMNVRAYYSIRQKHPFLAENGHDLLNDLTDAERHKIGQLIRYFRATGGYAPPASPLDKFLDDIRKNGCPWDVEAL